MSIAFAQSSGPFGGITVPEEPPSEYSSTPLGVLIFIGIVWAIGFYFFIKMAEESKSGFIKSLPYLWFFFGGIPAAYLASVVFG